MVTFVLAMLVAGGHCLLYTRHCASSFTCIISFTSHNPVHFTAKEKETELACTYS